MISPLTATQSAPIASIQQNADAQSVLRGQNAIQQTREEEREVRETVVQKDEAAYYEKNPDAKEEGKTNIRIFIPVRKRRSRRMQSTKV